MGSRERSATAGRTPWPAFPDHVMFALDEVGGMAVALIVAAEAACSGCIERYIVDAGHSTHLSGWLYRAATVDRGRPW